MKKLGLDDADLLAQDGITVDQYENFLDSYKTIRRYSGHRMTRMLLTLMIQLNLSPKQVMRIFEVSRR